MPDLHRFIKSTGRNKALIRWEGKRAGKIKELNEKGRFQRNGGGGIKKWKTEKNKEIRRLILNQMDRGGWKAIA